MALPKKTRKMPAAVKSELKVRKTRAKKLAQPKVKEAGIKCKHPGFRKGQADDRLTPSQEARRRFAAQTHVAPGIVNVEMAPLSLSVVIGDEIDVAALFESSATQERFNRLVTDIVDEATAAEAAMQTDVKMVNTFAGAMHTRMALKRDQGRGGWNDTHIAEDLASKFLATMFKDTNLVDMGNYLGMLYHLGPYGSNALARVAKCDLDAKLSEVVKHNASLREVAEKAKAETVAVRAELQRVQSNLSRALGYIDAATEAPRTVAQPYREERSKMGEMEHVLVQGERRGPQLDLGVHSISIADHGMDSAGYFRGGSSR